MNLQESTNAQNVLGSFVSRQRSTSGVIISNGNTFVEGEQEVPTFANEIQDNKSDEKKQLIVSELEEVIAVGNNNDVTPPKFDPNLSDQNSLNHLMKFMMDSKDKLRGTPLS